MRRILALLLCAVAMLNAAAVPANPMARVMTNADGSTVTLRLVGDEFYSYSTTLDGYTVLPVDGSYEYARRDGSRLAPTGIVAHDVEQRTASELAVLSTLSPRLTDRDAVSASKRARAERDEPRRVQTIDYAKFRGLIILVNYTDVKFKGDDPQALHSAMVNSHNYTGYDNTTLGRFTGSVRDYYYDNSNGNFDPVFDVVGPVNVNYASTDGNSRSRVIFQNAVNAVDSQVDFSKYDADGDGVVDMIYFIVAGHGSNVQGNDGSLLWPYKSGYLFNSAKRFDGKRIDVYACSTQLMGQDNTEYLDGIGTICHEFTHVLGFPDLYDTNYETGGQSHDPGTWDIMAGGGYLNNSRTPAGYSIFERYTFGWANPPVLESEGEYTLPVLGTSNTGYILKTPVNREFFMLENRQSTKWDSALPGHGMIVVRVDSTNVSVWNDNTLNCDPNHNYYELLRAGGSTEGSSDSDPFPGKGGIRMIDNSGIATGCLRTWNGTANPFAIFNIAEVTGGDVTFNLVSSDNVKAIEEDFETMDLTTKASTTGVEGNWATWSFTKCSVSEPGEGHGNGSRVCSMIVPSVLTMTSDVNYVLTQVRATAYNTSASAAKLRLYYSINGGTTWKDVPNHTVTIPGSSVVNVDWVIPVLDKPVRLRWNMTAGSRVASAPLNIDDIRLYYDHALEPEHIDGDVNGDGKVNVGDVNYVLNLILLEQYEQVADVNHDNEVNIGDVNYILNIILTNS